MRPKHLLPTVLLIGACVAAQADTLDYSFAGSYNTVVEGQYVQLGYTGSFTVADPAVTSVRPASAPDPASPAYAGIWAGTSTFYTGAGQLSLQFANGATLSADTLELVVNNTTLSESGAPYPLGLSVQLYPRDLLLTGMVANKICPDGSTDDACDDYADANDVDPLFRKGDAADRAAQRITGVYFAFYDAPLSSVAAGVPNLATAFGGSGLGVYSVDELGRNTTTLTSFSGIAYQLKASGSGPVTAVPEPGTLWLCAAGLALLALQRRGMRRGA
ncbi:PEP-CTERM sorting domain-containing protein [Aquariibacter albus]|uniref:PEP-CTERM sorting domain-containing protein n=1 Tax=Aquariibacter albus TaxID=2759899 RepID=A0A839HFG5_9BURK|nr:PEP-CTERM sorting domain-containing protein [Aquariibacter albus]MBB1160717.1 PEP-CTERM sorting domain-containing protein [Aquariibacter albus]